MSDAHWTEHSAELVVRCIDYWCWKWIILTAPGGALISHWQRAFFGYLCTSYPGDLMIPVGAVNSTGLPPVFKTIELYTDNLVKLILHTLQQWYRRHSSRHCTLNPPPPPNKYGTSGVVNSEHAETELCRIYAIRECSRKSQAGGYLKPCVKFNTAFLSLPFPLLSFLFLSFLQLTASLTVPFSHPLHRTSRQAM